MSEELQTPIYNVSIPGSDEKRKAIDLEALKQFMDNAKMRFSLLNIDVDKDPAAQIDFYVAKAAIKTLAELEYTIDLHLGLIEETEEPDQEIVEEEPKAPIQKRQTSATPPPPPSMPPKAPQTQKQPQGQPQTQEQVETEAMDDDETIVL